MSTQTGSISFESTKGIHSYAKQNYATLSQIKGQFATCGTGASTAAKVATIVPTDSNWELYTGATITVKFSSTNSTTTPTLNVNGTGAKQIRDYNGQKLTKAAREWGEGAALALTYDGTYWRIQDSNLMERVHTAETEIDQNARDIALRATKEELEQSIDDVKVTKSTCGRSIITEDAADLPLLSLDSIYGESVQNGTPTPSAPVYIQTVRGKNLLPLPTWNEIAACSRTSSYYNYPIQLTPNTTYHINTQWTDVTLAKQCGYILIANSAGNTNWKSIAHASSGYSNANITTDNTGILYFNVYATQAQYETMLANAKPQLELGTVATDYVPYDHLAIASESNGSTLDTAYIDLKGNELHGLDSTYYDQLDIDASGHAVLTKRTGSKVFDGTEAWSYQGAASGMSLTRTEYLPECEANQTTLRFKSNLSSVSTGSNYLNFSDGGSDVAAWKTLLGTTNATLVHYLPESAWYTIDLGYIDLPQVTDNSTVYVAAEVQPQICGSWWTKSGQTAGNAHQSTIKENAELRITSNGITSEVSKISSAKYVTTGYNYTLAQIKTYAAEGHSDNWTIASDDSIRVGDTVYVKVQDTTRTCPVYIKVKVTAISSPTRITGVSHGYEDVLPVETIKSTINQSSDSVKIAANHIEIDGTATFKNSDNSTTTLGSYLSNNYDSIGTAQDIVDNLKIGGTNLLLGTRDWSTISKSTSSTATYAMDGTYNGCDVLKITSSSTSTVDTTFVNQFTAQIEADSYYTFSFWAKASESTSFWSFWYSPNNMDSTINQDGIISTREDGGIQNTFTTSWERYSITWHIKANATSFPRNIIIARLNSNISVWLAGCKFEKGNKATDWSPAPEDQKASVQFYNTIVAGENLAAASLIGGHTDGKFYQISGTGDYFDLSHPLLWLTAALNQDATDYSHIYTQCYDRNLGTYYTSFTNTTANRIVYLVGTVNGNNFTVYGANSSQYLTVTPPTTEDGKFYIPIGRLGNQSNGKNYFNYQVAVPVSLYSFIDGKFRQVTPTEIVATQKIYYRSKNSGNVTVPTTWITSKNNIYNETVSVGDGGWSTKVTPLSKDKTNNIAANKYLYLYTCEQRKRLDGTVECIPTDNALLDDSTTVIDGGNIITGTVTANQLNAADINASNMLTVGSMTTNTQDGILNSNVEIGGTNLLLEKPTSFKQTDYDTYIIPATTSAAEMGAGTTLTIQFWDVILDANSSGIGGYWGGGSSGQLFRIKPDANGYCSKTFTISTTNASHSQGANKTLCLYNMTRDHSGMSLSIGKWKLEKGNKATDWSPAPEDQKAYVDAAMQGGINLAQTYCLGTVQTTQNVTCTGIGPTTIRLNGTSAAQAGPGNLIFRAPVLQPGRYCLWLTDTNNGNVYFRLGKGSSNTHVYSSAGNYTKDNPYVFDVTTADTYAFYPVFKSGVTFSNFETSYMLEAGEKATVWKPAPEDLISKTQRIYYRKNTSGAPSVPSSWITIGNNGTNYYDQWTTKVPPIKAETNRYLYLYTCEQSVNGAGTLTHTTVLLDDSTTVIDGGKIITGTIETNAIKASSGTFDVALIPMLDADHINTSSISIGDLSGSIGGRNLLLGTAEIQTVPATGSKDVSLSAWAKANVLSTDDLTISFDAVAAEACYMDCYWRSSSTSYNNASYFYPVFQLTTSKQHFEVTDASGLDLADINSLRFRTSTSSHGSYSVGPAATITNLKLVKGERSTDWTPAPEDVDSAIDDASKIASNYIHADSTGINIYDNSLTDSNKYYLRQTAGGTYIYRNSYLKAKYEDTITLYGGSNASGTNPKVELSSTQFKMTDSGGIQRLLLDSTNGAIIGRPDKGRVQITDSGMFVYDTNNKKRTQVDANGLTIYDASATPVDVANFGTTVGTTGTTAFARIGQSGSSRFEISPTTLSAYTGTTKYFEVSSSGLTWGTNNTAATKAEIDATNRQQVTSNLLRRGSDFTANDLARARTTVTETGVMEIKPTTAAAYAKFIVDYLDYAEYGAGVYKVSCEAKLSSTASDYTSSHLLLFLGYSASSRIPSVFSSTYDRYTYKIPTSDVASDWTYYESYFAVPQNLGTGQASALVAGSQLTVMLQCSGSRKPVLVRNVRLEQMTNANVEVKATAIDYVANTATLAATMTIDGIAFTPSSHQWYKNGSAISGATSQTCSVTDLDASYSCQCTWGSETQTGNLDLKAQKESSKTATTYITSIDSNKGITIKPSDSSGNDYLQMNSTDIRFVRNNVDVMNLTDSAFRIGSASGYHSVVDTSGLHVWSGAESTATNELANFGSTARIGKTNSSRFLMNTDSLQAYNNSNVKYFEVSSRGIKWGAGAANTVPTIGTNLFVNGSTFIATDVALTTGATVPETGVLKIVPTASTQHYGKLKVDYLDYAEYGSGVYRASCEAKLAEDQTSFTSSNLVIYLGFSVPTRIDAAFASASDRYYGRTVSTNVPADWTEFSATFAVPQDLTTGQASALAPGSMLSVEYLCSKNNKPVLIRNMRLEKLENANVTISITSIDYTKGEANLSAALTIDGISFTPSKYQWFKGATAISGETSSTYKATDLNAIYSCECTW